jgi:sodium/hydrogen exchanger 8
VLPEAAMVILVGMVAGCIVDTVAPPSEEDENMADNVAQSLLSFSPTVFFVVLLPPIIFNSGYHVRRDLFFRYITPICLYACFGTCICTAAVAGILYSVKGIFTFDASFLELMAFGALISATDPVSTLAIFSSKKVDPHLFYLVFGESVINDAVGLVLFEALSHLVESHAAGNVVDVGQESAQFLFDFVTGFLGSLCLGTLFGLAVAFFLRKVDFRKTPLLELCLYVTIMYFPFVVAEILRLSGIVTVLFTGIAAKRYAEPNLSVVTAQNADTVFRLIAHLTETVIFLELGLSFFALVGIGAFHFGFIVWSLFACFVGRAINIYPITLLFNLVAGRGRTTETPASPTKPSNVEDGYVCQEGEDAVEKKAIIDDTLIPWAKANMLWFSGLRGAVSYALVRTFPQTGNENVFVVTTIFIVLVTTFVFGGSTEWAMKKLGISVDVDEVEYLKSLKPKKLLFGWLRRFESITVRSWVIREFHPDPMIHGGKKEEASSSSAKDTLITSDYYHEAIEEHEHVELTEVQHLQTVCSNSLYDFGQ